MSANRDYSDGNDDDYFQQDDDDADELLCSE